MDEHELKVEAVNYFFDFTCCILMTVNFISMYFPVKLTCVCRNISDSLLKKLTSILHNKFDMIVRLFSLYSHILATLFTDLVTETLLAH
jgi:hypothetical protein